MNAEPDELKRLEAQYEDWQHEHIELDTGDLADQTGDVSPLERGYSPFDTHKQTTNQESTQ